MQLTKYQRETIVGVALSYLNHPYLPRTFECVDFVREVYQKAGISLPKIKSTAPPADFNISLENLSNPAIGHLVFLRDKQDPRPRAWTHVALVLNENECIHCSVFFGYKVVVSSFEEIFERYEFAPSAT